MATALVTSPVWPLRPCSVGSDTTTVPASASLLTVNIPLTVKVVPYAVNVEPTLKLFLLAMLLLIMASLLSLVPSNALPLVIVSAVVSRVAVSVVPVIDTGGVKLVGRVPPPATKK